MADSTHYYSNQETSHGNGSAAEQIVNGSHPVIQDTKSDFKGLAGSGRGDYQDGQQQQQPMSHFHSLFYDLFTWKSPKATGFFFFSTISLIFAFRYVNVLRYVFKAAYMLFAAASVLELAGKPLGAKGIVSSMRPTRYYTVPRESLEMFFENLHDLTNFFVLEFQRVLFVENIFTTIAAFVSSFFGYILIKYIPFWTLLLLATVTAFTAPLIYINNKELIDEQIQRVSDMVNSQVETTKKLTGKYAEEAAVRAKATAADLQSKVQTYTKSTSKKPEAPSTTSAHEYLSKDSEVVHDYPAVPSHEPHVNEPLLS
ncbi:Reticulon-domain-containing protein [Tricharina praecox]|uniref:Reticulon-domain-containing protein n=1 Tax=Tricharina praecox TaxID=43433 RepID=UPI00221E3799|nr:Reticulon-domain-containing protein [Tricharina praecox]KAI5848932.1 Reticulon-domain-containing protein [Tricharina praecox]